MLTKSVGNATPRGKLKTASHTPATDTAAVITLEAQSGFAHLLQHVQWSYASAPTNGRLTMAIEDVTVFDVDITSAGPGGLGLTISGGLDETVTITLAAAGVVGKLNAQYTTHPARSL